MFLSLKNITKTYGSGESLVRAVDNIDFSVGENEFVAIMGKSGCGKTTLINILATNLMPDSGTYMLGTDNVTGFNEKQLAAYKRSKVSVIFQHYNLIEELTVKNNIILPFIFDKRDYDKDEFASIVKNLGIDKLLDKYPSQLSGGEKQRAAIARAVLLHPYIILADEPTGNLDYENAIKVMDMLRFCADEYKQTIIMVTHDNEMAGYADRIVTMKDGKVAADSSLNA